MAHSRVRFLIQTCFQAKRIARSARHLCRLPHSAHPASTTQYMRLLENINSRFLNFFKKITLGKLLINKKKAGFNTGGASTVRIIRPNLLSGEADHFFGLGFVAVVFCPDPAFTIHHKTIFRNLNSRFGKKTFFLLKFLAASFRLHRGGGWCRRRKCQERKSCRKM